MIEKNQSKACDLLVMKSDNILQDRIGVLPDELLIHIISYLPLGLAVGTSAISRRWGLVFLRFRVIKNCLGILFLMFIFGSCFLFRKTCESLTYT